MARRPAKSAGDARSSQVSRSAEGGASATSATSIIDASVYSPLPIGARDLLPETTRRRRAVSGRLVSTFERWGYREVTPPLIEYFEVLGRGLGADEAERCVRFIEAGTGELVSLRSDVTPQIARMVAQRVGGSVGAGEALRLCYAATLVRLPSGRDDRAQRDQVGIEYVGEDEPVADAELVGLAHEALVGLGLEGHRFDLAHTAVVREVFAHLGLSPQSALGRDLLASLARKDRGSIVALLRGAGWSGSEVEAVASLCELHGPPSLLPKARRRLAAVGAGGAVDRLRAIVETVAREYPEAVDRIMVDLGEVRGFDYYTGMRMRVWSPGASEPIVRGGRYNDMLARYGADMPATGFAVDLDALEEALIAGGAEVVGERQASARLVATAPGRCTRAGAAQLRAAAVAEARDARRRGLRAWIDADLGLEAAQATAERRGAERLTWFEIRGRARAAQLVRERWRRGAKGWRRESRK